MIAAVLVAGLSCVGVCGPASAGAQAVRMPAVVVTCEVGCILGDVVPPSRLDVVMNGGGTVDEKWQRCEDMGGQDMTSPPPRWWRPVVVLTCESVDF